MCTIFQQWVALGPTYLLAKDKYTQSLARAFFPLEKSDPYSHSDVTLWGNPQIKISHQPILWQEWAQIGIVHLSQCLTEEGRFKQFSALQTKFSPPPPLPSNSTCNLKHSIVSKFGPDELNAADLPHMLPLLTSDSQRHHVQAFLYADLWNTEATWTSWSRDLECDVTCTQHFLILNSQP